MDKWLLLNWRRMLYVAIAWVLAVVIHNVIYGLTQRFWGAGGDEPFFFLLAVVVIPAYLIVAVVYTIRNAYL